MRLLLTVAYHAYRLWCFIARPLSVSVKLLLVREGRVLLVEHSYQPGWRLPGGGVKRGETLTQATHREAREELGATLSDLHCWGIYTDFKQYKSDHLAVFVSEDFILPKLHTDAEIERAAFFALEQLPEGATPGTRRRVAEYLRGARPGAGEW